MTAQGSIVLAQQRLPLSQFHQRVQHAASGLQNLGLKTGDTLALLLRNETEFLEATFAAAALGCYPVPINWHFHPQEVGYVLQNCQAKVLVGHTDLLQQLGSRYLPPQVYAIQVTPSLAVCDAHGLEPIVPDPAWPVWSSWLQGFTAIDTVSANPPGAMLYTGGTTGHPKGVRYQIPTPEQTVGMLQMRQAVFGLRTGVRTVMSAPLYHSAPFGYAQAAVRYNGQLVLMARFDAERLLQIIESEKITHLYAVPTMFVRLLKLPQSVRKQYDLSSLEWVVHAAAPCAPEVKTAMIEWLGPIIHESYASTETGWLTHCDSTEALQRPGTVGRVVAGAEIKIIGENGQPMPTGEAGDVYGRHHSMPDFTYYGQDDKRRAIEREGLVTAGDIGYLDEAGYLYLCDRKIDMIISGGVNIYPAEIEAALIGMSEIADCAVFGIPDDEFGERVAAALQLVPQANITAEEISARLRQHIAGFKVPRHYQFMSALPRLDSGKLLRRKLRDPHWQDRERSI